MTLIEDEKYIYAKTLEEIKNDLILLRESKFGANSNIYIYKITELLKVFNKREPIYNMCEMELLQNVSTTNIVKPHKFLFVGEDYFGFSMKRIKGSMFAYVHPNTLISDFLNSLVNIENDLKLLSKEGFCNNDLNILNLIYNKKEKESYIIDSNSFVTYKDVSKEKLLIANLVYLYSLALSVLAKVPNFQATDNYFFLDMRDKIYNKTDFSIPINQYFIYFKEYLEDYVDKNINTLADFRKALKLTNN